MSEMRRSSITSLRRSSSSQGFGLEALETKLARSTTPKIAPAHKVPWSWPMSGRTDSTSNPLASVVRQEKARGRARTVLCALRPSLARRQNARALSSKLERPGVLARWKPKRPVALQPPSQRPRPKLQQPSEPQPRGRPSASVKPSSRGRKRLAEEARRQHELRKLEEARAQEEAQRVAREEQLERERQAEMSASMHRSDGGSSELTVKPESGAIESRRLGSIGAARSPSSATSLERIQAAIAPAPSSIAPSVPSKTTRPTFGAPSRTSDRDRVVLKREAVHRIDGWLSNAASPNASHMNAWHTERLGSVGTCKD